MTGEQTETPCLGENIFRTDFIEDLLNGQVEPPTPFVRWHLRKKFEVMGQLFGKYLKAQPRFADIGCGDGDALVLASHFSNDCELWGLDVNQERLDRARRRLPEAILREGSMHDPTAVPKEYFNIVHEFGAAFIAGSWDVLAKNYFSLLRDGGILLWELPRRWSLAHISYLLSVAPKNTEADTRIKRILRTFSPSKYRFEGDTSLMNAIRSAGDEFEILERIPIWHFYCPRTVQWFLDWAWKFCGDNLFETLDRATAKAWPKEAGYYLVLRKHVSGRCPSAVPQAIE